MLQIEGKIDEIRWTSASKAHILHGPPTFVLKYAQDVIFIYLVVQQNVNMAEFWIQTSYYFFILEMTEHFFEKGTGMLNSSWIPYISNQSNLMLQNQTAVIQFEFVSITYNLSN